MGGEYYGEWSKTTNLPHGKGVFISNDKEGKECIQLGIFNQGAWGEGPNIIIYRHGGVISIGTSTFKNGETYRAGVKYNCQGVATKYLSN